MTNTLRHGAGDVVVHASIAGDETVRVTVTDWSDESPRVLPPDPTRVGGVGLRVVEAIATAWGVAPFPGGKTVWASIGRPATVAERAVTSRDLAVAPTAGLITDVARGSKRNLCLRSCSHRAGRVRRDRDPSGSSSYVVAAT